MTTPTVKGHLAQGTIRMEAERAALLSLVIVWNTLGKFIAKISLCNYNKVKHGYLELNA